MDTDGDEWEDGEGIMKNYVLGIIFTTLGFVVGVSTGMSIVVDTIEADPPTITFDSPNTGMWQRYDKGIGIVVEGEHILTIYQGGLEDVCK